MKGLIRNNFYNVEQVILGSVSLMIISLIWIAITPHFPHLLAFTDIFILGCLGSFSSAMYTMLQNDNMCKWNRFELTTPISKSDVVKAKYISYAIFAVIAIIYSLIATSLSASLNGGFSLEGISYNIGFAVVFGFLTPAIFHPLVEKFGFDKGQLFFIISAILGAGAYLAPSLIFSGFIQKYAISDLTYRITLSIIAIILLGISYIISKKLYVKKDI